MTDGSSDFQQKPLAEQTGFQGARLRESSVRARPRNSWRIFYVNVWEAASVIDVVQVSHALSEGRFHGLDAKQSWAWDGFAKRRQFFCPIARQTRSCFRIMAALPKTRFDRGRPRRLSQSVTWQDRATSERICTNSGRRKKDRTGNAVPSKSLTWLGEYSRA